MTTTTSIRPQPYRVPVRAAAVAAPDVAEKKWSHEWTYFAVIMVFWCFTPLVRRLIDWHNGAYNPIQVISLAPYAAMLPLAYFCFRRERLARISPAFKAFAWIWFATFSYGFVVALFNGNVSAGAFEAIQYITPMLAGVWLAGQKIEHARLILQLSIIGLVFGGIVALYGCAQFVNPPPWDVLWVQGGEFTSIGNPVPFQMRVFATLNQAGPAADFFVAMIMLSLPAISLKRLWIWPMLTLLGAALLLTLVRSSWIGLVLGVIAYLCVSPRRFRALPFLFVYASLLAFLVASLPAFLGASGNSDVITSRIATLGDVDHDTSALARSTEISDAFQQGLANPIGSGLGMIGASSALSANPTSPSGNNLDSGYMARFIELGWLGFGGYLVVVVGGLGLLIASAFRSDRGRPKPTDLVVLIATAAAMCAALAWGDAAGDSHLGLDGFLFWIAMGIGFRRPWPGEADGASRDPRRSMRFAEGAGVR